MCNKEFSLYLLSSLKEFFVFVSAHLKETEMLAFEGKKRNSTIRNLNGELYAFKKSCSPFDGPFSFSFFS